MTKPRRLKRKGDVRDQTYKVIKSIEDTWLVCLGTWEGTKEVNWSWNPISIHDSEANAEKEIRRINEQEQNLEDEDE